MSSPMIAITTNNSTRVNPARRSQVTRLIYPSPIHTARAPLPARPASSPKPQPHGGNAPPPDLRNSLTPLGNRADPEISRNPYSPLADQMIRFSQTRTPQQSGLRMTAVQEKAITLALNTLHVGFFECPRHYYQYF